MKRNNTLQTVLGVSLIHGQFLASAFVKGEMTGSWSAPSVVEGVDQLQMALAEAIRATHFSGQHVSLLVEDRRLVHQYHLVPPMNKKDLDVYLGRMADREKWGEGPAVWRYRTAMGGRGQQGVLLDVWPQSYVDEVIQACQAVQLTPIHLFPLSAVFVDQVRTLGAEPDDILLLVTRAVGKIVLVIATGEGKPLFDRFLSGSVEEAQSPARIGQEITRTLLFVNQQFEKQVGQVWVMGESEGFSAEAIQPHVDMPILGSPIIPDPAYWIFIGTNLPPTHDTNFIPKEIRQGPRRRAMAKISVALLVGLVCFSVSTTSLIEALLARGQSMAAMIHDQVQDKQREKGEWVGRVEAYQSQQAWAQTILTNRVPPLAGWFLGYLGEILPDELVLDRVSVVRDGAGWNVALSGTGPQQPSVGVDRLTLFENRLVQGPYHVVMTKRWQDGWLKAFRSGSSHSTDRPRHRFEMEGRIQ